VAGAGRWAEQVLGPERCKGAYSFKSLLRAGARLVGAEAAGTASGWTYADARARRRQAFGSDWFVAPPSPLLGIYAATTRRTLDGGVFVPEEIITAEVRGDGARQQSARIHRADPQEALRAYTVDAAFAGRQEDTVGSLAVGKQVMDGERRMGGRSVMTSELSLAQADFAMLDKDILAIPPEEIRYASVRALLGLPRPR
jgi:predicted amidohydrolase YtcJ